MLESYPIRVFFPTTALQEFFKAKIAFLPQILIFYFLQECH